MKNKVEHWNDKLAKSGYIEKMITLLKLFVVACFAMGIYFLFTKGIHIDR